MIDHITFYHVWVLHLAALLKLLVIYGNIELQLKAEKKNFVWQIYFKDNWDNWAMHYVSMWLLLITLPALVDMGGEWIPSLKSVKENTSLNTLGTVAIGFFGYD